ncbi:MAG: hypothetical protein COY40_02195 [Alphaproteobacteria bacterium CG_4_10_14_0_8_um_filter_53_9]|nr:MAG: hypothetical protein COY40_02195 [Alphaproteobacteria bacterium CG_4_10_14_0_8_um_filter_53_9]
MKSMSQRQSRVAEEVRHIAGRALLSGHIHSPVDLTRLTLQDVWVSADLRLARLYINLPEDIAHNGETLEILNKYIAPQLRKIMAKDLATKYIPSPTFHPVTI